MAAKRAVMFYVAVIFLFLFCGNVETVTEKKKKTLGELLKTKGLSVLHQNIRGLLTNFSGIQELLSSCPNIDVLTLSETHISATENIDQL